MSYGAAADKTVQIWETGNGKLINTLTGHAQGLSDLAWTENSRKIATASDDKLIKIFDVETVRVGSGGQGKGRGRKPWVVSSAVTV